MSTVRLDLRALSKIKSGTDPIGVICRVVVAKNRIVAPWREVSLAIPFYRPISPLSGLIPVLLKLGVLKVKGQFLVLEGKATGLRAYSTRANFLKQDESAEALLDQNPDLLEVLDKMIEAREEEGGPPWEGASLGEITAEDVEEGDD